MSTTFTHAARAFLASRHDTVALVVDALAVILLLALLVQREVIRVFAARRGIRVQHFTIAIAPALVWFALIVVVRALNLR